MKKINITTIALLLMIGATLVIIILLRYLQVKRLRMRDKWNKDEDPAKQ